jgi:hypothetical protein
MFVLKEARRAMLAAYTCALRQGASHEAAVAMAVARYRAFLPEASIMEVRALLSQAISTDAGAGRAEVHAAVH